MKIVFSCLSYILNEQLAHIMLWLQWDFFKYIILYLSLNQFIISFFCLWTVTSFLWLSLYPFSSTVPTFKKSDTSFTKRDNILKFYVNCTENSRKYCLTLIFFILLIIWHGYNGILFQDNILSFILNSSFRRFPYL